MFVDISAKQLGLTVVDVAHDRDHRGPGHEVGVVLVGLEVDVEGLQELAVLVLGRDDLDVVAQLGAQEGEGVSSRDWVAVAISPRWNRTVTRAAGWH